MTTKIAGRDVEPLDFPDGMEDPDVPFESPTTSKSVAAKAEAKSAQSQEKLEASQPKSKYVPSRDVVVPDSARSAPILNRFREVFGLKRIRPKTFLVARTDPNDRTKMVYTSFGFRPLSAEDFNWIVLKSAEEGFDDSINFRMLIIAISLSTLDMDLDKESWGPDFIGTPLYSQLGITPENLDWVRDPLNPHINIRIMCAEVMFPIIRESMYDVIEEAYINFESLMDSNLSLIKEAKKDGPLEQET